jgi:hypothetical protein
LITSENIQTPTPSSSSTIPNTNITKTRLTIQNEKYLASKKTQLLKENFFIEHDHSGLEYILIKEKLKNGIECYKYNYTLDQDTQDPGKNSAILNISRDENSLIIHNRITLDKL